MVGSAFLCVIFQEKMVKNMYLQVFLVLTYRNDPKFSDRYAWANSADPGQTAPRGPSVNT